MIAVAVSIVLRNYFEVLFTRSDFELHTIPISPFLIQDFLLLIVFTLKCSVTLYFRNNYPGTIVIFILLPFR